MTHPHTFQRASVVDQAADFLRRSLHQGEWPERLPGERFLCDLLQVSRPTLRAALVVLEREELIRVSHGRSTRTFPPSGQTGRKAGTKAIGLVLSVPLRSLSAWQTFLISELRRHLQDAGYPLEIHTDSHYRQRYTPRLLEKEIRQSRADVWVLHRLTAEAQRWFAERKLPALVLGSNHPGVRLPSIDVDYRAVCRHAVGVFLSRGHRRIGLVIRNSGLAGDLASEQGFREGFSMTLHPEASSVVLRHDESIPTVVNLLLEDKSRPTALLVAQPADVLSLLTSLTHAGLRVPDGMSLIARDDESFLNHVTPSIARYRCHEEVFARRFVREVIHLATTRMLVPRQIRIGSIFRPGDTLGRR